jgi:uncharacterized protein YutE (UPF0331/DUF86 family)
MVDETRLRGLLDRIGEELSQLRRLAALEPGQLLADGDLLAAVKYRFIVAIETAIDICRHIVASEQLRVPTDFADAFAAIGEAGYVPPDLVPVLQDMAHFRNLLVRGYAKVDDARVVEILRTSLGDIDAFRRSIAAQVTGG